MTQRLRLSGLFLLTLLGIGAMAWPSDRTETVLAACPVTITSVQPNLIANTAPVTITVTGTNFDPNAVIVLDGYSALATTQLSNTLVTAVVPAGVPGKTNGRAYDVRVLDPDGCEDVLNKGLTVMSPAPATKTPVPTETPGPTDFVRPLVTILSYVPSTNPPLYPGQEFEFAITVQNNGQIPARNVVVVFPDGDVIPRDTGGTRAVGDILPGGTASFSQPLRVNSSLGSKQAAIQVQISYNDEYGKTYQETSVLSFEVGQYASTPTPTATLSVRPQLVIEDTSITPEPLTPGMTFQLGIDLVNVSSEVARQIVMTLTTAQTATTVLAPSNGANVRYVDQLGAGERITVVYDLAIDGSAPGGLVPIQVAMSYIDNFNVQHDETAVISLSIETLAVFTVDYFEALSDPILVGDAFDIPIEVINIGDRSINVNTVEVLNPDNKVRVTEGSLYIGPLDGGTSASLVGKGEALQAADTTIEVRVHYLDAFQREQVFVQTLPLTIEAAPIVDAGDGSSGQGGQSPDEENLTLGQRLIRALLGFLGLGTRDSLAGAGTAGGGLIFRFGRGGRPRRGGG